MERETAESVPPSSAHTMLNVSALAAISTATALAVAFYMWRRRRHPPCPVFIFVDNDVHSRGPYMEYVKAVLPTVPRFGGRYLCRQGKVAVMSGSNDKDWNFSTTVLLEFPTVESARSWLDDVTMAPLHAARQRNAKSRMLLVSGVPGTVAKGSSANAYVLVDNVVHNAEAYGDYIRGVTPTVAEHGGRYVGATGCQSARSPT